MRLYFLMCELPRVLFKEYNMNGGLDPDPGGKCWSCGKIAFLYERDAMGGLWLKDGVCNKCREAKLCVKCRKKLKE